MGEAKSPGSGRVRVFSRLPVSGVPSKANVQKLNIPGRKCGSEGGFGKQERKQLPRNITSEPIFFSRKFSRPQASCKVT